MDNAPDPGKRETLKQCKYTIAAGTPEQHVLPTHLERKQQFLAH
jgi:hypothetical protein